MALGTARFWVRFRVAAALTSGPVLSYVSFTGNTHEWGIYGEHLLHGHARKYKRVSSAYSDITISAIGSDPSASDLYHSNTKIGYKFNRFESGKTDRHGWAVIVPSDVDTSAPLRLYIYHTTATTATGNVDLSLTWASACSGVGLYDNSAQAIADPNANERSDTFQRTIIVTEKLAAIIVELPIPEYIPASPTNDGTILYIELQRNGGAALDTFTNNLLVTSFMFEYVQRMDGVPIYNI